MKLRLRFVAVAIAASALFGGAGLVAASPASAQSRIAAGGAWNVDRPAVAGDLICTLCVPRAFPLPYGQYYSSWTHTGCYGGPDGFHVEYDIQWILNDLSWRSLLSGHHPLDSGPLTTDGCYGPRTTLDVRNFQYAMRIPTSGIVDYSATGGVYNTWGFLQGCEYGGWNCVF